MVDRVQFFASNDLAHGYNLVKIESIRVPDISKMSINDAIEFYEIKRYFDSGTRLKSWEEKDFQIYQAKSNQLYTLTLQFFNGIDNETIAEYYRDTEILYHEEFWQLFVVCKLYKKISTESFENLICTNNIASFDLFRHKELVKCYGDVLRTYLLAEPNHISVLLYVYNQDTTPGEKLYLPKELTSKDISTIFEKYIDSELPSINILKKIELMRPTGKFTINDELRLKAKRRKSIEIEKNSNTGVSIGFGVQVSFDPNQTLEKVNLSDGKDIHFSYSIPWLLETLDYPTILNNFIYIFDYVDVPQIRLQHVSKVLELSTFERISNSSSSRMYPTGIGFKLINGLASMQMVSYYNLLESNNIHLENVLEWVFTEYLQREYHCPRFRVTFPSENMTYAEKCTLIITAIETVLKQFSLYVKSGEIDFELVTMSSSPLLLKDVPSLLTHKYVYGVDGEFIQMTSLLFSDQCLLTYVKRIQSEGKSYTCLFDLLRNEEIFLRDYPKYQEPSLRYLEQRELVSVGEDGRIKLGNTKKIGVLIDLYKNEVISRWHYGKEFQAIIRDWLDAGILKESNGLLSNPEVNYFNYLLNRTEYDNGLEIRNKYVHGVQQVNLDEEEHKQNYFTLLRIMVLLAIKINDEFELKELLGRGGELDNIG